MNSTRRSRSLLGSFFVPRVGMSTKKPPTHYETLEVNPRATQSEIKAAYFDLSKQYHPDKNSSDEAIAKFRDVAEAYEVLGNFDSRKHYDRSLLTHTPFTGRKRTEKPDDPKMKYYQTQAAVFKSEKAGGTQTMYDFDAWTKAHYGKTFQKTIRSKAEGFKKREQRMSNAEFQLTGSQGIFVYVIMILLSFIMIYTTRERNKYDDVASKLNHIDKVAKSESRSAET